MTKKPPPPPPPANPSTDPITDFKGRPSRLRPLLARLLGRPKVQPPARIAIPTVITAEELNTLSAELQDAIERGRSRPAHRPGEAPGLAPGQGASHQ
jgi:hypothetical protein